MNAVFYRPMRLLLASLALIVLASCGGGGGDPGQPILANPPTIRLVSLAGNAVLPNQTVVLQAQAFDQSGRGLAGATVNFTIASNGSGGVLSSTSATTDANGVARVLYTSGPVQGVDAINATVTGAQGKTGTASLNMQVGGNPNAGPQVTIDLQTSLAAGQTSVAPNSTVQITATVRSNGQPVANQPVKFSLGPTNSGAASSGSSGSASSGPTLNGASTVEATTDSNGQATVTYVAGPQAGTDTVIANYSLNQLVIGTSSISIAVQPSAAPNWAIRLEGTPNQAGATCTPTQNAAGVGLICTGITHNSLGNNGAQSSDNGVTLLAVVTDRQGAPVPNAVVSFSLGSVSTSNASLSAGFVSATGTTAPTILAVTDANGDAIARYVAGGRAGVDTVLVAAGYNAGTPQNPSLGLAQGSQSASMNVQ